MQVQRRISFTSLTLWVSVAVFGFALSVATVDASPYMSPMRQQCFGTPFGNTANGSTLTAYSSALPTAACSTVSQTRTCNLGTFSGSFANTTCTDGCAVQTVTWSTGGCSGPTTAAASGGSGTVTNTAAQLTGSANFTCTAGVVATNTPVCADLYAASVVGLFHFEGSLADSSGGTWTNTGSPTTSAVTFHTGSGGGSFPADAGLTNNTSGMNFGLGDFTIEGWFYVTASGNANVVDTRTSSSPGSSDGLQIMIGGTRLVELWATGGSAVLKSTTVIPATTWTHVAVERTSSTVSIYINGTKEAGTAAFATNMNSSKFRIGGKLSTFASSTAYFADEYRITKVARYAANFTPPTYPYLP